jgi:hypothetical protein
MFSLLNKPTLVGNYPSLVCKFLSFSTTGGSEPSRGSQEASYVLDGMAVIEREKNGHWPFNCPSF